MRAFYVRDTDDHTWAIVTADDEESAFQLAVEGDLFEPGEEVIVSQLSAVARLADEPEFIKHPWEKEMHSCSFVVEEGEED